MKNAKKILITTLLLTIFGSTLTFAQEESCNDVLAGLYDYEKREFDSEFWKRYVKEIDEKKFNSLESFKSHNNSIGVSIPIPKLPIDFSFKGSGKVVANKKTYNSFREFIDENVYFKETFKEEFKKVNESTTTAWLACMQNKRFVSWYTINDDYLNLHIKRGQFSVDPLFLRLKEIKYSGENLELLGEEKIKDGEVRHKKTYRWKIIGGSKKTITFKIKDKKKASFITLTTNSDDYTAHHDIRGIIPDPPIEVTDKGPERVLIPLDGGVYMTRGYWAGGRKWTDFKCHTPVPNGFRLVVLSTTNKRVGWGGSSHCSIKSGYCDGHNEFCVNYWFKKACFVNEEWVSWYKKYCEDNNLPFTESALCQE